MLALRGGAGAQQQQQQPGGAVVVLRQCAGCLTARHCGDRCQRRHWRAALKAECEGLQRDEAARGGAGRAAEGRRSVAG